MYSCFIYNYMIKEYMIKYNLTNLGVVTMLEKLPNLFIVNNDGNKLLEGVILSDNGVNPYYNLSDNEIIIVAVSILMDGNIIDSTEIDHDKLDKFQFNISPLQVTQLKTIGLTIDDVFDLDFFELLILDIVHKYVLEKS